MTIEKDNIFLYRLRLILKKRITEKYKNQCDKKIINKKEVKKINIPKELFIKFYISSK